MGSVTTVPTKTGLQVEGFHINVKDYGATGDGTTDDTAAIQAALDAIELTGGTLFFPIGTYLVSGLDYVSNLPIRIVGEGANILGDLSYGSQLKASAGSNTILHIDGSSNFAGCAIERMGFVGNGSYNSLIGVHVESKWQTTIRDCAFNQFDGTSSVAIKLVGSAGKLTITSLVDRCRIRDATTGVLIDYVTSPSIVNSYIANCKTLIDASGGNGDTLSVLDCQLDGGTVTAATAISCNLPGSRINNIRFEMDADDYGVTFGTGADNSTVANNYFYGALTCITVPSGCTNVSITGNQFSTVTNLVVNSEPTTLVVDSRNGNTQFGYKSLTSSQTIKTEDSGKILLMDVAAGATFTLPAHQAGLRYTFVLSTLLSGGNYLIKTPSGDNRFKGRGLWHNNGASIVTCEGADQINFIDTLEKPGDWVTVECTGYWWVVTGYAYENGGITSSTDA